MKISRKTKKELKKQILSMVDCKWKSKNVKIDRVERYRDILLKTLHIKG